MNEVLYILMAPCPLCVKVGLPQNQMCSSQISKKVFVYQYNPLERGCRFFFFFFLFFL